MESIDQSNKTENSSSPTLGGIIGSLESDDEVARAFAAAVSVSKMSPAHKAEARTLQDEQQRALLEKHHSAALAKAQWEEHLIHPELMVKDAFHKITKHTPQEIEAAWKCKTKEMQHKLKELSSSLKLPGVQPAPLSLFKPAFTSDVSTGGTNSSTRHGNTSLSQVQQSHIRRQSSWRESLSLEKSKIPAEPFEISSAASDAETQKEGNMVKKEGDIVDVSNFPAIVTSSSVLTCNSTESVVHQESSTALLPSNEKALSKSSPDRLAPSSYHQSDLQRESVLSTQPALNVGEPTLSAAVWKRREGLAKFSGKTPWERRKLELQDTKLFYFATETLDRNVSPPRSRADSLDIVSAPSGASEKGTLTPFALPVSSWIEHAAAALSIDLPATFNNSSSIAMNPSEGATPRGCIDLIKENATVTIVPPTSLTVLSGQIGGYSAPTPFCLAIKIEEKTKWKFCFDTHKQQVQWLVALSNVVVQHSINEYISEQVSKSPDGAQIVCTMEDDFYVLKDRNNIVSSRESSVVTTEETQSVGMDSNGAKITLAIEENYYVLEERNDFFTSREKSMATANDTHSIQSNARKADNQLTTPASPSNQRNSSCSNGVISIPLSSIYRFKEPLIKVMSKIREETDQPFIRCPVILYLIGDRLDIALCTANAVVIYTYCYSESMHLFKFVLLLWLLNTIIAFCCNIIVPRKEYIKRNRSSRLLYEGQKDLDSAEVQVEIPQQPCAVEEEKYALDACAGSTTTKITSPDERKDGVICWMEIFPSDVMVRSIGYLTSKKKIPSPGSLYECIAVDVLECDRRIPDIGLKVKLDQISGNELLNLNKTWVSPEVFVISVTLPTEAPRLGWATDDGIGLTLVAYMKMRDDTREILRCITGSESSGAISKDVSLEKINGVRLFEEWCKKSPSDPAFQGRFKFIPSAVNTDEFGIPSYIAAYNGKPVLIKRAGVTGTLYSHADYVKGGFMEFDINLHAFPYLAKQAFSYMKDNIYPKIILNMAFAIEGRNDNELPEVLIGGFTVFYPDPDVVIRSSDFFRSSN